MIRIAPLTARAALDIGIEFLRTFQRLVRRKNSFRMARGKASAIIGRTGLHIDRTPLRRTRQVQSTSTL